MDQDFRVVLLQDIEDNKRYDIHPFLEDTQLNDNFVRSIERIGVLSPPVIIERTGGKYELICGRHRIRHLRSLHRKNCYCQLLGQQCPEETILTIILEDQFANGPLTTVEQAHFIKLCQNLIADQKRQSSFFQDILPGRITKGNKYLAQLLELEGAMQAAIHFGIISEKIITEILHFNVTDQRILLSLIESLNLGGNNQKKLILQLRDILKRNDISLVHLTEKKEIQEILLDSELDRTKKTTRLMAHIQRLYQPLFTSSQDSFEKQIKTLKLPENVAVTPTHSFEKDDVTLSVRFRSLESFKKKWKILVNYLND